MGRLADSIDRIRALRAAEGRFDSRLFAKDAPRFEVRDRKILLAYLFSGLGDAALLLPVLKAVAEAGPKGPIGVLVPKGPGERLLKLADLPLKLHVLGDGREAEEKLKKQLYAGRYAIAADLSRRDGHDARPFLDATDADVRLGFVRPGERLERLGLTFGAPDTRTEAIEHWSRTTIGPLAALGIDRPRFDVLLPPSAAAKKRALALFNPDKRRRPAPRLLLVPGARAEEKRWDPTRFVELGRAAVERFQASVVVLGGPSESKLVRGVVKAIGPRARPYTGKDLATLVELVRASSAVVTNDTGPMHVAFLLEAPTIAIFTYMSPLVWGPPKADPRFVVINASRASGAEGGADVWTRLALHHLEGMLGRATP